MHRHADDDHGHCHGEESGDSFLDRYHHIALPVLSGLCLLAAWLLELTDTGPRWLHLTLYGGSYLAGGYEVLLSSVQALLKFRFDIDLCIFSSLTMMMD